MIEARMNMISVSQLSTLRWDLETDVDAYASHGFGGIGLYRPKVDEFGIERVSEMLLDYQTTGQLPLHHPKAITPRLQSLAEASIPQESLIIRHNFSESKV